MVFAYRLCRSMYVFMIYECTHMSIWICIYLCKYITYVYMYVSVYVCMWINGCSINMCKIHMSSWRAKLIPTVNEHRNLAPRVIYAHWIYQHCKRSKWNIRFPCRVMFCNCGLGSREWWLWLTSSQICNLLQFNWTCVFFSLKKGGKYFQCVCPE
jgi:hypothetical protein